MLETRPPAEGAYDVVAYSATSGLKLEPALGARASLAGNLALPRISLVGPFSCNSTGCVMLCLNCGDVGPRWVEGEARPRPLGGRGEELVSASRSCPRCGALLLGHGWGEIVLRKIALLRRLGLVGEDAPLLKRRRPEAIVPDLEES